MTCKFFEDVKARWQNGARVCVGLDPDLKRMPWHFLDKSHVSPQLACNERTIKATASLALCYKINPAYYRGPDGYSTMRNTVAMIHNLAEGVPIIYDGKFGDGIAKSNQAWAEVAFDDMHCDAVTVHHHPGKQAMLPFLEYEDKGIFVLCRSSGNGSDEFQDCMVKTNDVLTPMYQYVTGRVKYQWNYNKNCGLVVGATVADDLVEVRNIAGMLPILMPGFGSQAAVVHDAVMAGAGKGGLILPSSSSGILFADDPKAATQLLTNQINAALTQVPA